MPTSRSASRRTRLGQSLVEFALILPILLTMFGAAVDVARVYGAWVTLEAATRDAAEQVATDTTITTSTAATTRAKTIVCSEMTGVAGYVAGGSSCTTPGVTVTWSKSTTAAGATTKNPIVTTSVTATFPFRTLFGYPLFTQGGAWNLGSTQSYSISQGRS
jgi:Flp pilus assembly protein TadG